MKSGTALLALAMTAATAVNTAAEWKRLAPLPEPNGGFVCGAVDGKIIVAGGTNWKDDTKRWLDRIWTFDPKGGAWSDAGRLDAPLAYAAVAGNGRTLWLASGSSGIHTHRTLAKFGAALRPQVSARLDRGFVYSGAALIGSTLYVVGGSDDQAHFEGAANHFHAIDVRNGRMWRLPNLPERGFAVGATAACGGRVFVFGGAHATDATNVVNHASAYAWTPEAAGWTSLKPLPSPRRGITAVTLDDRRIFLAGGYKNDDEGFTAEAFIYDTKRDEYLPAPPLPYAAMVGLVKVGDDVFCLGGEDKKKQRTDAVFKISVKQLIAAAGAKKSSNP